MKTIGYKILIKGGMDSWQYCSYKWTISYQVSTEIGLLQKHDNPLRKRRNLGINSRSPLTEFDYAVLPQIIIRKRMNDPEV